MSLFCFPMGQTPQFSSFTSTELILEEAKSDKLLVKGLKQPNYTLREASSSQLQAVDKKLLVMGFTDVLTAESRQMGLFKFIYVGESWFECAHFFTGIITSSLHTERYCSLKGGKVKNSF